MIVDCSLTDQIKLQSEWDCLASYLWDFHESFCCEGADVDALRELAGRDGASTTGDSWARDWLKGSLGVRREWSPWLRSSLELLEQWVRQQIWFNEADYETYRLNFASAPSLLRQIKLRDEWDCVVSYLRGSSDGDPQKKVSKADILRGLGERLLGADGVSSWFRNWLERDAGLRRGEQPMDLNGNLLGLVAWVEAQDTWFNREEYDAHRRRFFERSTFARSRDYRFVGRKNELNEIHENFEAGQHAICLTTALTGIGGQGKTAIAEEIAETLSENYGAVLWLDFSRFSDDATEGRLREALLAQLMAAASELADTRGLVLPDQSKLSFDEKLALYLEVIISCRRGYLMLVLDDLPPEGAGSEHTVSELFVRTLHQAFKQRRIRALSGRVKLLLTCRRQLLPRLVRQLRLDRMNDVDAQALFLERSGFELRGEEVPLLKTLVVDLLGGHPLSIVLVASFVRSQGLVSIEPFIEQFKERMVDLPPINDPKLKDYPRGLINSLGLSFSCLSKKARYLLLALGLFRRGLITLATFRGCVQEIPREDSAIFFFLDGIKVKGTPASFKMLERYSLVETFEAASGDNKEQVAQLQLHEVIYDYTQLVRAQFLADVEAETMRALELGLTQGTVRFASGKINEASLQKSIEFNDVETVTGLLVPTVSRSRGLFPTLERISVSLEFWFHHTKFQNFVYDTGLQELLLPQLERLHAYVEAEALRLNLTHRLALVKLLGHAYYSNPSKTAALAREFFDEGLELSRQLLADEAYEAFYPEIRWYQIFFLDHRSNVASKKRPEEARALDIREDPYFKSDFDEIEQSLPRSLLTLDEPKNPRDCELLLRAAHYWGHRGNQDAFILMNRLGKPDAIAESAALFGAARDHYRKAAVWRLFALKAFEPHLFGRYVAKSIREGRVMLLPEWFLSCSLLAEDVGCETLTSLSQGIGDAGHQYRGYHSVCVYEFLSAGSAEAKAAILQDADAALRGAQELWRIAGKVLKPGEVLLKYRLWMASSQILQGLMESSVRRHALPEAEQTLSELEMVIGEMQKTMKSVYSHAIEQQKKELSVLLPFFAG